MWRLPTLLALLTFVTPPAAPATRLHVGLAPGTRTQLYRAPGSSGGAGAWIITGQRPGDSAAAPHAYTQPAHDVRTHENLVDTGGAAGNRWSAASESTNQKTRWGAVANARPVEASGGSAPIRLPSFTVTSRPFGLASQKKSVKPPHPAASHTTQHGFSSAAVHKPWRRPVHRPSPHAVRRPSITSYRPPSSSYHMTNERHPPHRENNGATSRPPRTTSRTSRPHYNSHVSHLFQFGSSGPHTTDSGEDRHRNGDLNFGLPDATSLAGHSSPGHRNRSPSTSNSESANVGLDDSTKSDSKSNAESTPDVTTKRGSNVPSSVTRKTSADSITEVGGQKLRSYSVGCKAGKKCSFIISVPTKVPQPTYTPYNKQAVDDYLEHYRQLLGQSNTQSPMEKYLEDQAKKRSNVSGFTHRSLQGSSAETHKRGTIGGQNQLTPSFTAWRRVQETPSPKRTTLRRPLSSHSRWRDQGRYNFRDTSLFNTIQRSNAPFVNLPTLYKALTTFRSARKLTEAAADQHEESEAVGTDDRRWSRFSVHRVDPSGEVLQRDLWHTHALDSSPGTQTPVQSGSVFTAHLSSGPLTVQNARGSSRDQRRISAEPVDVSESSTARRTATIITADGLRQYPNQAWSGTREGRRAIEAPSTQQTRPWRRPFKVNSPRN